MNNGVSIHQVKYASVSPVVAAVITERYATLNDLQNYYGVSDLYKLYEIACVNRYNSALIEQYKSQRQ